MSRKVLNISKELKAELSNDIQNQYEYVLSELQENEIFLFDDLIDELLKYTVSFCHSSTHNYIAYADFQNKTTTFNVAQTTDYTYTILHELAHQIVDIMKLQGLSGPHCLEFAIVTYALMYRFISNKSGFKSTYFRAYDIHEDLAYSSLCINVSRFDDMIRAIDWDTLTTLSSEAKRLANKIRNRIF